MAEVAERIGLADCSNAERPEFCQVVLEHRLREALLPKRFSGDRRVEERRLLTT